MQSGLFYSPVCQVADRVGVSRGDVAKIERGHGNPPLDLVERIAVAVGLELDLRSVTVGPMAGSTRSLSIEAARSRSR